MREENFWSTFAAGAVIGAVVGVGGVLAFRRFSSSTDAHVVRLEKSINIGRPVTAVFNAWSSFERLPDFVDFIEKVERYGMHSRWWVNLDGKRFQWDAEITQLLPNQSIGWKSLNGPKHSGRISFAPLREQTLVHVTMNYVPPLGEFGSMLPIDQYLEDWIERGLRAFKAVMESGEQKKTANY